MKKKTNKRNLRAIFAHPQWNRRPSFNMEDLKAFLASLATKRK